MSEQNTTQHLYVPQLQIPYELVNMEGKVNVIPHQIEEGVYRIKTPIEIHIAKGATIKLKTGIKLMMPKYIDASPCRGIPEGVATSVFPRMVLHAHLDSIFDLLVEKGLSVLGPRLMSADDVNGKELVVYLQNLGKEEIVMNAGDEIAVLYYTIMPISTMVMAPYITLN